MRRWIKPVIIGLLGLFAVLMGFSLLLPDHVMTSKWVRTGAPRDSVIARVGDLHSWPSWNLLLRDAVDISISDSTLSWTSPRGTYNRIRIDTVNEKGVSTSITLNDSRPFISGFAIEQRNPSEDSVQVVWYIIEELKWYPWEKFYGMMAADMKGPLMEASLRNLSSQFAGRRE
jgi:hypothetical protein